MFKGIAKEKFTPPELAAKWGIDAQKVLAWIRSGELRAIDASTTPGGRRRFLIDVADIASFEERRTVQPPPTPAERRRQRRYKRAATEAATDGITKFF